MSTSRPAILLFRNDLRLSDHAALTAACTDGRPVICLYVNDPLAADPMGAAQQWWLHHSLTALSAQIELLGGQLVLRSGPTQTVLSQVIAETLARTRCTGRVATPLMRLPPTLF